MLDCWVCSILSKRILNAAARAVTNTSKFSSITRALKSPHWLKIEQHIQFNIFSLTYKGLLTKKPTYLYSLLTIQDSRNTRSSSVVAYLWFARLTLHVWKSLGLSFILQLNSGIVFLLVFMLSLDTLLMVVFGFFTFCFVSYSFSL